MDRPNASAFTSEQIAALVNEHTEALLTAAFGLGWPLSDAEELVQEAFTTFLKAKDRFEGRSSLKTFLIGILYHKSKERRRAHAREQANDPVDEVFEQRFGALGIWRTIPSGPEDIAEAQETARLLEDCLAGLTEDQRMAFYLKEVEHSSTEEVCKILDVTVTHLGVLLFRARNKLRECIQKKWGGRK